MEPDDVSLKFYDRAPPDDDIRLEAACAYRGGGLPVQEILKLIGPKGIPDF